VKNLIAVLRDPLRLHMMLLVNRLQSVLQVSFEFFCAN